MTSRNNGYRTDERGQTDTGLGLLTLALGAAIGAAGALLLTSKSAQELRAQVAGTTGSWKDRAAELLVQGRERLIDAVEHSHGVSPADPSRPSGPVAARD